MKHIIDKILSFAISKKLTVFLISCIALFSDKIDGEQFMVMASVYVGTQGIIDAIKEYYKR